MMFWKRVYPEQKVCSTTKTPGLHLSLYDHYSCIFPQGKEIPGGTYCSSFHMAPKITTDEEDETHTVIQQNPFPPEKGHKAPLYGTYSMKQIISFS